MQIRPAAKVTALAVIAAGFLLAGGGKSADPTPAESAAALDPRALAELELEHSRALDALLAAEARLNLLCEKVFDSRLVVSYQGSVRPPFVLARVELDLDGALAYRNEFSKAPSSQAINLFEGQLPPGRHVLALRVHVRGPDDPEDSEPGYLAASGMTVHLRPRAVTTAVFEASSKGKSIGKAVLREAEPGGRWNVDFETSYKTRGH